MGASESTVTLRKSKKANYITAIGVVSIVAGAVSLPANIIGFLVRLVGAFFTRGGLTPAFLGMLAGFLFGVFLLVMGIKALIYISRYKKIYKAIHTSARVSVKSLSESMGRDIQPLFSDLANMSRRGLFEGMEIDLERKELVIDKTAPPAPLSPEEAATVFVKTEKRSTAPIYIFGLVWLFYSQTFPLYRWFDFVFAIGASLLASFVFSSVLPNKVTLSEAPRVAKAAPPSKTGDPGLDEFLDAAGAGAAELARLELSISSPKIKEPLQDLLKTTEEIFEFVKAQPGKVRQIRQFMNYFLPTAVKLLKNYEELEAQGHKGGNITSSMEKIEDAMENIKLAFSRELDGLFSDKAMDISSDIVVLQQIIERDKLDPAE